MSFTLRLVAQTVCVWMDGHRHVNWWWGWSVCFGKIDGTVYSDQISMSEGCGDYRPQGQGKWNFCRCKCSWNGLTLHVGNVLTIRMDAVEMAAFCDSYTVQFIGPNSATRRQMPQVKQLSLSIVCHLALSQEQMRLASPHLPVRLSAVCIWRTSMKCLQFVNFG